MDRPPPHGGAGQRDKVASEESPPRGLEAQPDFTPGHVGTAQGREPQETPGPAPVTGCCSRPAPRRLCGPLNGMFPRRKSLCCPASPWAARVASRQKPSPEMEP